MALMKSLNYMIQPKVSDPPNPSRVKLGSKAKRRVLPPTLSRLSLSREKRKMASMVSLSLYKPEQQLKSNSCRKFNLTPLHLRRFSCCSTREISLKSRYGVALPVTCKHRRSVELFTRRGATFLLRKRKSFGEWVEAECFQLSNSGFDHLTITDARNGDDF